MNPKVPVEALFEVVSSEPQQTKEVGAMLCAHLATDGFQATMVLARGWFECGIYFSYNYEL